MPTREQVLATSFVILLSLMAVLGTQGNTPTVPIAQLGSVDQYTEVMIEGILVDLWLRDDGSESLVLLDSSGGATAKVLCARGVSDQPSSYASIGDLLLVRGELAGTRASPLLYSQSDEVKVLKTADLVVTVTVLARNWVLFEGDCLSVTGFLAFDELSESARLFDSSGRHGIALHCDVSARQFADTEVVVTGILRFDSSYMSLYVQVESLSETVS